MVEYVLYECDENGFNKNWIWSIDRTYNSITPRTIIKNSLQLLKEHNVPFGRYNIDIIKGPKSKIQDGNFYEFCIGYANINYSDKGVTITESEWNTI